MAKYYVGVSKGKMEVFCSETVPTFKSHGMSYFAVIGPFRTKRGAQYMAQYGYGNPNCQTVTEAEHLGKLYGG